MTKKITALLIVTCILFAMLMPCAYAANSPFYKLVAKDYFESADYNMQDWGQQLSTVYVSQTEPAGVGWDSNWLEKSADGSFVLPTASHIQIYPMMGSSANRGVRFQEGAAVLYRMLKTPINLDNGEGSYVFSIKTKSSFTAAGPSRSPFAYKIGEAVTVGYNWNANYGYEKVTPYITVNGNTVTSTESATMLGGSGSALDTLEIKLDLNTDGEDTITFTVKYSDSDKATVSTTAELSGIAEYIVIDAANVYFDDLVIEYDNPARYDIINGIINGTITDEATVEESFKFISTYTGDNKGVLIYNLKAATVNNPGRALKLTAMTPAIGNEYLSVYAYETEKFELEYNFALQEGAVFNLNKTTGGTTLIASAVAENNKVVINLEQPLENGVSYEIVTAGTDFKGDVVADIDFTVSPIYKLNVKDGDSFSEGSLLEWEANGAIINAELKNSAGDTVASTADSSLYSGYALDECGDFTLTFAAEKNGYTDTLSDIAFYVDEDFAPVATNVEIDGIPETGETLTGVYDWSDENDGDSELNSIYEWYRITAEGEELVGNELTYTLTEADENADLRFEVTPGANSLGNPYGSAEASEVFTGAYKPVVTNPEELTISGGIYDGIEADTSGLVFEDINGDEIAEPLVKWYVEGTDEYICDGNLTITEAVYEKRVYATVTPVSTKKPYNGDAVKSESVLMPSAPVVSDVRIEGNGALNSVLIAYYSFADPNLDVEGESRFEWKDSAGNVIGMERRLTVTSSVLGKTVTVTVTGVSEKAPYESVPVSSAAFTVPGGSSGVGGGFTGGFAGSIGGFGYSSGGTSSGAGSSGGTTEAPVVPVTPVTPVVPEKETVFGDVYGHWAQEYVTVLLEEGIVTKDENFRPDDSISRAEMLAMLFRSAGIELSAYNGAYGDVQSGDWFADYIQTALDAGIISPDDNFRPNDSITREEAAKIIAIMLKLNSENASDFADASAISDWATEFVNAVYEAGIFKGDDEGNFNPKGALTRAETATVIFRLLEANAFNERGAE